MNEIQYIDQTLRDGPQSLWGMRISPAMILPIASDLDGAGFQTVDFTGGNLMAVVARGLRQDPWEGLRLVTEAFPRTPLRAAVRADGITMSPASPELMQLWIKTLARHGVRSLWIFDVLFNVERLAPLVRAAKDEGMEVLGSVMWSDSPYHTDAYYESNVKALVSLGIDGIYVEDTAGCLTPERTNILLPAVQRAAGELPIELDVHNTIGLAPACYIEGLKLGITRLHTAIEPLADAGSLPSLTTMLTSTRSLGYGDVIDDSAVARISQHFHHVASTEGLPKGSPPAYDSRVYDHQMPGGMMGTLKVQLAQLGLQDRLDEVLAETGRVRRELGYPGMATPFSQFVGTQAVMNLISPERYDTVPDEVVLYLQGYYGQMVGPVDDDVRDRVLSTPRASVLRDYSRTETVTDLRRIHGTNISDGELILRAVMPGVEVDTMIASGPVPRKYDPPILAVVKRMLNVQDVDHLRCTTGDLTVELVRASAGR